MPFIVVSAFSSSSDMAAKLLKPATRRIFKTNSDLAGENLAMNLSCNLLGIIDAIKTTVKIAFINYFYEKLVRKILIFYNFKFFPSLVQNQLKLNGIKLILDEYGKQTEIKELTNET